MPNIKSAIKAMHQSRRRRQVNLKTIEKYKKALREFRKHVAAKSVQEAKQAMNSAAALIDKAIKKGRVHKNKAARLKSRMAESIKKISQ